MNAFMCCEAFWMFNSLQWEQVKELEKRKEINYGAPRKLFCVRSRYNQEITNC